MRVTIGTRVRNGYGWSGLNNLTRRLSSVFRGDPLGILSRATDTSFTTTNTISSAGSSFPTFPVNTLIRISGSALNSRVFLVASSTASTITVVPALISSEVAGPEIFIQQV